MNRTAWSANISRRANVSYVANILSVGLLLAVGIPCPSAAQADGEKAGPQMSPEARILGDPDHPDPPAEGSFGPDASYDETEGIPIRS